MSATSAPVTEKHRQAGVDRECRCGSHHSVEWWDGYDAGREDGFEEGADWSEDYCETCRDYH